jgi:hypothetical chaperone protein
MAHDVEQAKIRCSQTDAESRIDLSYVENDLATSLSPADLHTHLAQLLAKTVACARNCVQCAELPNGKPDAIYLTGGSSALRTFQQTLRAEFAGVPLVEGDLFGGVASGLVYSRH